MGGIKGTQVMGFWRKWEGTEKRVGIRVSSWWSEERDVRGLKRSRRGCVNLCGEINVSKS